jgi:hypothetical protein
MLLLLDVLLNDQKDIFFGCYHRLASENFSLVTKERIWMAELRGAWTLVAEKNKRPREPWVFLFL